MGERHRQLDQPHVAQRVPDHQLGEHLRLAGQAGSELKRQLGIRPQLLLRRRCCPVAVRGLPQLCEEPQR